MDHQILDFTRHFFEDLAARLEITLERSSDQYDCDQHLPQLRVSILSRSVPVLVEDVRRQVLSRQNGSTEHDHHQISRNGDRSDLVAAEPQIEEECVGLSAIKRRQSFMAWDAPSIQLLGPNRTIWNFVDPRIWSYQFQNIDVPHDSQYSGKFIVAVVVCAVKTAPLKSRSQSLGKEFAVISEHVEIRSIFPVCWYWCSVSHNIETGEFRASRNLNLLTNSSRADMLSQFLIQKKNKNKQTSNAIDFTANDLQSPLSRPEVQRTP